MTVSPQIPSDRDLELLSAYLDGELTDRETKKLEQRLARENTLQAALDELRKTVALVRDLPRLKAPRSFTLDPALYTQPVPWWKRLVPLKTALQLSGALGAVASIALIILAFLLNQGTSDKAALDAGMTLSDQAAPAQPSMIAMQASATAVAPIPTSIAYTGEGLIETTIAAQSQHYAGEQTTSALLPTPTTAAPAAISVGEVSPDTMAATTDIPEMDVDAAGAVQEEAPAVSLGNEESSMMEAASDYPPPEAQDAVGGAAPVFSAAAPAPSVTDESLAVPQAEAPVENGFQDDGEQSTRENPAESQPGSTAATATEKVVPSTTVPEPVVVGLTDASEASLERLEEKEEKKETSQPRWWLAGIGLLALALSVTLLAVTRRKKRG